MRTGTALTNLAAHWIVAASCLVACFNGSAATSDDVKERQLQDLNVARSDYVLASKAFSDDSRARALSLIDTARTRAGAMSDAEFTLTLASVAAQADNAHDELHVNGKLTGPRLPIRLAWIGDELVVVLSAANVPELAGARVLRLAGKDVKELDGIARNYIGGPASFVRNNSTWLWESPALMAALGFKINNGAVQASFKLRDGQIVDRLLNPLDSTLVPPGSVPELLRNARTAPGSGSAWNTALLGAPIPMSMKEPHRLFRAIPMQAYDALYIQFRANIDRDNGRELGKFAGDTAALAVKLQPRFIIIDQRFNGGGNSDLTQELMKVLAGAAREKVYILTSEHTFSAGIVSSAIAKQAAGSKARVVGAPVGDRLRWWSENPSRCLPNSGHCFRPSYGLWDLRKGCGSQDGCFGDAYGVRVTGLDPDIAAPLTAADWLAGYDAALMAAAADAFQSTAR